MNGKYDLKKMLQEIKEDEKQGNVAKKKVSQNEIKEMLRKSKKKTDND